MSEKKICLAFVSTGLQLLNVVELIKILDLHNVSLVVNADKPRTFVEIESVLNQCNWKKVVFIPPKKTVLSKNKNFNRLGIGLVSVIQFYNLCRKKVDIVIGNNINPYYLGIIKYHERRRKVVSYLIDDGSGSLNINFNINNYSNFSSPLNKWIYISLGIKKYKFSPDFFFTSYYEKLNHLNVSLIPNKMNYLKSKIGNQYRRDVMYFIGDPHVERGYLSVSEYIEVIRKIKAEFNTEIIYFTRAMECEKKLFEISKYFEIVRDNAPLEILMCTSTSYPSKIITFHSSVLFNINQIYGARIEYFWMRLPKFTNQRHMESLKKIWSELDLFANEFTY